MRLHCPLRCAYEDVRGQLRLDAVSHFTNTLKLVAEISFLQNDMIDAAIMPSPPRVLHRTYGRKEVRLVAIGLFELETRQ